MTTHNIALAALETRDKAQIKFADGAADIWTERSIQAIHNTYGSTAPKHYAALPGKYRVPFRVDLTVKLDFPMLIMQVGSGYVKFASPMKDNRKAEDLAFPGGKPNAKEHYAFDNHFPYGEWTDISVIYGADEMQVMIGGEERYYSRKMPYMSKRNRTKLAELNAEGFAIGLAVQKRSVLSVKSITVTEYEDHAPISHSETEIKSNSPIADKPTFESVLSDLPPEHQAEIRETDELLRSLMPLKFKRSVDKNGGKITWVSSGAGVSFSIRASGAESSQDFRFYIVTSGKPETWHRVADHMEEALMEIAQSDAALAERIFYALNDCVGCYGPGCLAPTLYQFNGNKRLAYHGQVVLHMSREDSADARGFFHYLNAMLERKSASGELRTEKIFMIKRA
jgi:hypothetical protein